MKYFKGKVGSILMFLLLSSCYSTGGLAPKDIKGLSISYYLERIGGIFDNDILHKNVVYKFRKSGTYVAYVDDKFFEAGDYTFHLENPSQVRIMLTYSAHDNAYLYAFVMNYKTNSSGSWHATLSNNPGVQNFEGGTFQETVSTSSVK